MKSRQSVYRPVVAGVIVLFVLLTAAGVQLWRDYVIVRKDLTEAAKAHARLVSENVERTTEAVDLVLSQVARRQTDVDWKTLENSRRTWINLAVDAERLPQIRSLWLVDQNGRLRLFSDKFPTPDLDVFERDYFQAHGQGSPARLFIGRTRKGKFSGKDFFSVSYPILAGRYNFRGVVAAAMEPSYYLPLISTFDERCDACRVLLLRDAGEVLLSTEPSDVAPDAAVPLSALQHFATLEKPQSHTRLESDWTAVVEHPSIAPITVAVLVPDWAVTAIWWDQTGPMVLTVLIAAGLIVVLLWRALVAARALAHSRARLIDYTNDLERAKDEEHRLRIQAAEANHAKSNFLAMMSHELRTPLNSVLGFGELIVQGRDNPQLRERSPEYAEDIVSSGTHLLSVLNDILDLSRIEAGRFELNEESFDLDVVVRSAARMVAQRVKQSGVALVTPPTGFGLYGDPRAIKQILVNLLSNAAKFTRAGRIMVDAWLEGDWLALRVSDTGIGMDPEGLARALQPFGQAESGHARPAEGTGLGLNIVRELARLHGGEMDIETAPGEGTTVVIRLPRERLIAWSDETDGRLRAFG